MSGFATLTAIALLIAAQPFTAAASDWVGGDGNWSSDANPGWNGSGVPNAQGAVANFPDATTGVTTQDITTGVTVGTISLTSTGDVGRTITNTGGITMDQDGGGPGFATISNSNTTVGANNTLFINIGSMVLNDDLFVSNTSGSMNTFGAVQLLSTITGTGNVTFSNPASNNLAQINSIRVQTGANTFQGAVLIQAGAVSYNKLNAFGAAANVITLGKSGFGGTTLFATAAVTVPNPVVVTAGTGGAQSVGTTSTSTPAFSGAFTLNADLTVNSLSTNANGMAITGVVSGVGGVIKVGAGNARLSNPNNTFAGGTTVTAGTLIASGNKALGTGAVTINTTAVLTLNSTVNNAIDDSAIITINGSGATAGKLNLLAAAGTMQETVGGLMLDGVLQPFGAYGSTASGAANANDTFFSGGGILLVGVVPEPSACALLAGGLALFAAGRRIRIQRA